MAINRTAISDCYELANKCRLLLKANSAHYLGVNEQSQDTTWQKLFGDDVPVKKAWTADHFALFRKQHHQMCTAHAESYSTVHY